MNQTTGILNLASLLSEYTEAERKALEFLSTYRDIICQMDSLQTERDMAQRLLEQSARSAGVGVENEMFAVTVSQSIPPSGRVRIVRQPGALFAVERPVTGPDPRD